MAEISFNAGNLAEITQSFKEHANNVERIRGEIESHIGVIKANWTGSENELAGREKDFTNILANLDKINANINSIAKFLEEKNTDFSQINYS